MPILFSQLLSDPAFEVKNRRDIKTLYEQVKADVKAKKLNLEGHTLPVGMNDFIRLVEGDKKLPVRDTDVVDFSIAKDKKYATWRSTYLVNKNPVYLSAGEKELLQRVQELDAASQASMSLMNGTKDDVVAALSDLQAAVYMFVTSYDKVQKSVGLPERSTPLERVKTAKLKTTKPRKGKARAEKAEASTATPQVKTGTSAVKKRAKPVRRSNGQASV